MNTFMQKYLREESGATAIEYGMIVALMTIAIVGSIEALGKGIITTFYNNLMSLF